VISGEFKNKTKIINNINVFQVIVASWILQIFGMDLLKSNADVVRVLCVL